MYKIDVGILKSYRADDPKICNVLHIPDGYMMSNIQLSNTLANQIKPKEGSLVLVARMDSYQGYMIAHLRDPIDFLSKGEGTRGVKKVFGDDLGQGEVYLESAGDPGSPVSGTGSSLHLGNDGTATLSSGKLTEYISVGGDLTDDDNEIIVNADNVTIRSNKDVEDTVESTMKFKTSLTGLDSIKIGRYVTVFPEILPLPTPIPDIPLGELVIEQVLLPTPGMQITLQNKTLVGTPLNSLVMTPTGATNLTSLLSTTIDATTSINLNATTTISLSSTLSTSLDATTTMSLNSSLGMTLDGLTINLNSGTQGVARKLDETLANALTDPAYWLFWTQQTVLAAALLPVATDPGTTMALANAIKLFLINFTAGYPTSITGKISSASTTVKAGG